MIFVLHISDITSWKWKDEANGFVKALMFRSGREVSFDPPAKIVHRKGDMLEIHV